MGSPAGMSDTRFATKVLAHPQVCLIPQRGPVVRSRCSPPLLSAIPAESYPRYSAVANLQAGWEQCYLLLLRRLFHTFDSILL